MCELVIELGGPTPGNGSNHHDQIQDTGTIQLLDSATLSIVPYEGYLPSVGDEFVVMTWEEDVVGAFNDVSVDPWFAQQGLSFRVHIESAIAGGQMVLTATSVPEPSANLLFAMATMVMLVAVRRERGKECVA